MTSEYQLSIVITDRMEADKPHRMQWLRDLAERLISTLGHGITADELRAIAQIETGKPGQNNFMGSVFRDKRFVQTGSRRRSETKGSHGNDLPVWTLR